MKSKIFLSCEMILFPTQILISLFLLFRGHNRPGGGFVGGLVLAMAFILRVLARGEDYSLKYPNTSKTLIASGLACSFLSGFIPILIKGAPYLTGIWPSPSPIGQVLGNVFWFDVGVYFLVFGVILEIVFQLKKEWES